MNDKKIIIFGAGYGGRRALHRIGADKVSYFVDNSKDIQGSFLYNKEIISVEKLLEIYNSEEYSVVVPYGKYYAEIIEQLHNIGISDTISVNEFLVDYAFRLSESEKRILLMNTHAGINIGDQLISEAEIYFFHKYLQDYSIIEIPADLIDEDIESIRNKVINSDIIAISGGGYMGSLWMSYGEDNVRKIIKNFPKNRIIVMPQTVYFEDTSDGKHEYEISKQYYNRHDKLLICTREKRSYELVSSLMEHKDRVLLIPDMALLLNKSNVHTERQNVGICFRNDKESILSESQKNEIASHIEDDICSFDMYTNEYVGISSRKEVVMDMLEKVSKLKYVVTDRLHCMIFCLITGTPCIAFDNLTGKVSGVFEWVKDNPYVKISYGIEDAIKTIDFFENNISNYQYSQSAILPMFDKLANIF